jgi:hypothetical protein
MSKPKILKKSRFSLDGQANIFRLINLDYSRVQMARSPRFAGEDNFIIAQVVRSARPKSKNADENK